ncbi:MAG TPA: cell envelope biogenesis protein TolA [Burkholderiales bacterium]|nr:cell envelope biogenesis protein TolA [Burkholderiales bacterium]
MKKILATLVAALFAGMTLGALAADPVKAGGATDKPGRAADEASNTVKAAGATDKPGRAADETAPKKHKKKKKHAQ